MQSESIIRNLLARFPLARVQFKFLLWSTHILERRRQKVFRKVGSYSYGHEIEILTFLYTGMLFINITKQGARATRGNGALEI